MHVVIVSRQNESQWGGGVFLKKKCPSVHQEQYYIVSGKCAEGNYKVTLNNCTLLHHMWAVISHGEAGLGSVHLI